MRDRGRGDTDRCFAGGEKRPGFALSQSSTSIAYTVEDTRPDAGSATSDRGRVNPCSSSRLLLGAMGGDSGIFTAFFAGLLSFVEISQRGVVETGGVRLGDGIGNIRARTPSFSGGRHRPLRFIGDLGSDVDRTEGVSVGLISKPCMAKV